MQPAVKTEAQYPQDQMEEQVAGEVALSAVGRVDRMARVQEPARAAAAVQGDFCQPVEALAQPELMEMQLQEV